MNRVLKIIHASYAYERGIYGSGIPVAILDTGVYPHQAVRDRILSFHDFVGEQKKCYDNNGHGTHISGIVGGYLPAQQFQGVAPGCVFHIYKVLNAMGNGKIDVLIAALRQILEEQPKNQIRVMNISVGMTQNPGQSQQQRLIEVIDAVWQAGIIVVAAAGNNGPGENTITCPGIAKKIITVGSADDQKTMLGHGLKRGYSGRGPTRDCIVKPEILAPGTGIRSCGNMGTRSFSIKSGTSMAAPVVTGMLALLLEKYPELTPNQVKRHLYDTCIPAPEELGCWGYLSVPKLLA